MMGAFHRLKHVKLRKFPLGLKHLPTFYAWIIGRKREKQGSCSHSTAQIRTEFAHRESLHQMVFDCSPELVWEEVQTSQLLAQVMKPWLRFVPLPRAQFPTRWPVGGIVRGKLYALGLIPLGTHAVHFEKIDQQCRQIQTREYSPLVQQWDHLISVQEAPDGKTRYSDAIEIYSGLTTFFVWLFAWCFYQYRQWRWKSIAVRCTAEPKRALQERRQLLAAAHITESHKLDSGAITVRDLSASRTVLAKPI